jgi:hypothetical protein
VKEFQKSNDYALIWESYIAEAIPSPGQRANDPYGSSADEFLPGVDDEMPPGAVPAAQPPTLDTIEGYAETVRALVAEREQAAGLPEGELWDTIPDVQWDGYIQMGFEEGMDPVDVLMQAQSDQ